MTGLKEMQEKSLHGEIVLDKYDLMKKILYILLFLIFGFSCTRPELEDTIVPDNNSEGNKVIVDFSITIPKGDVDTKGLAENPDINSLHIAVFDAAGFLLEYKPATAGDSGFATENATNYQYTVELTPTTERTIVHFIANGPESVTFGNETKVIGNMYTEGGVDAYWQRIVLENGIEVDNNGVLSQATEELLTSVPLIRNFARIEVELRSDAASKFTLEKIYVANTPDKGSIAIYNTGSGSFLGKGEYLGKTHDQLYESGYYAFVPFDATLVSKIPESTDFVEQPYFVYERETPTSSPAFILLEGTYTGLEGKRYFKVDLRKNTGEYFPIFRNFIYKIIITDFLHTGKNSPEDAFYGAGSGDVSSDIEYKDYTNISNGQVQLYVSTTHIYMVDEEEKYDLKYKFLTFEDDNGTTIKTVRNDLVEVTPTSNELSSNGTSNPVDSYQIQNSDDSDGWRTITLSAGDYPDPYTPQTIMLTLTGANTVDEITYSVYREVNITLMEPIEMTLECIEDAVPDNMGEDFDVVIGVPGGLTKDFFPLDFQIEADKLSITPDNDNLPVETGLSIIPGKEAKKTYRFIKSLSKEEYDGAEQDGAYKKIYCNFKTNIGDSKTDIYVANHYFTTKSTYLDNYTPYEFTDLSYSPHPIPYVDGMAVDFSFTMETININSIPVEVTVALDGLEPVGDSQLTYIKSNDDGYALYSFRPSSLTNTLKLRTTSVSDAVDVILSAPRYITNHLSGERDWRYFKNLSFENLIIGNENARFVFSMETTDVVTLTFDNDNVIPNGLTSLGNNKYEYQPTQSGDQSIQLTINGNVGDNVGVSISANGYETENITDTIKINTKTVSITISGKIQYLTNYQKNKTYKATITINGVQTTVTGYIKIEGKKDPKYKYEISINNIEIPIIGSDTIQISLVYRDLTYTGSWSGTLNNGNYTINLT